MAFRDILAPIRPHQRLTVNTDIGTFVVFLCGKVGDISGAGGASFLDDMVISLYRELMAFVCVSVMLCDIIATTTQVKNTKTMLAFVGEMGDDAITRDLRLVGIALKTDVACGVVCVPFGGVGPQFFVGGGGFLRRPCTTGEFVGGVGDDTFGV